MFSIRQHKVWLFAYISKADPTHPRQVGPCTKKKKKPTQTIKRYLAPPQTKKNSKPSLPSTGLSHFIRPTSSTKKSTMRKKSPSGFDPNRRRFSLCFLSLSRPRFTSCRCRPNPGLVIRGGWERTPLFSAAAKNSNSNSNSDSNRSDMEEPRES